MSNPNNCATCDHKPHGDMGHCYMFRTEPAGRCLHHTCGVDQKKQMLADFGRRGAAVVLERKKPKA